MSRKRVLVTGGCGFIGTNLCQRLRQGEYSICVVDNLTHEMTNADWSGVEIIEHDIREPGRLPGFAGGMDAIVHLAAFGSVVDSVRDPSANFEHNVVGTFNVLEAARAAGVRKLIFASTGGALIGNAVPPVSEESLPKPISPYGAGKLCGEAYCHAFARAYGIETIALRFANVYGPYSAHKKGAVTAFIKAVMSGNPIAIYGDGSATRDFLHVADLCDGIERALANELEPGSVLHLASGTETRVDDLARMIARAAGRPNHPIEFRLERPGEVERTFARYDRALAVLGFRPKWDLERGLTETLRWFGGNLEPPFDRAVGDARP